MCGENVPVQAKGRKREFSLRYTQSSETCYVMGLSLLRRGPGVGLLCHPERTAQGQLWSMTILPRLVSSRISRVAGQA